MPQISNKLNINLKNNWSHSSIRYMVDYSKESGHPWHLILRIVLGSCSDVDNLISVVSFKCMCNRDAHLKFGTIRGLAKLSPHLAVRCTSHQSGLSDTLVIQTLAVTVSSTPTLFSICSLSSYRLSITEPWLMQNHRLGFKHFQHNILSWLFFAFEPILLTIYVCTFFCSLGEVLRGFSSIYVFFKLRGK